MRADNFEAVFGWRLPADDEGDDGRIVSHRVISPVSVQAPIRAFAELFKAMSAQLRGDGMRRVPRTRAGVDEIEQGGGRFRHG